MSGASGFQQDAQKGQTSHPPNPGAPRRTLSHARPQQAKGRCVLCSVRGASEQSENAAGGLFQHPARSAVFYLPPPSYRLLYAQQPQFGTGFWLHLHANTCRGQKPMACEKRENAKNAERETKYACRDR